jgi:RNA ligase
MTRVQFDYEYEIKNGFIAKKKHPEFEDLIILNYTDECVYEKHWNEITLSCRGLILNEKTKEVIARPFRKFFNFGEDCGLDLKIPNGKPVFNVKMDGSLGISYVVNNQIYWSTRGSFESEQAIIANQIWNEKYKHIDVERLKGITLLAEIIDPKTRIVVDYKGLSDLILIGAIRIEDGYDYNFEELKKLATEIGMNTTDEVPMTLKEALENREKLEANEEGWVLRWDNGFRLKIKGEEYLRVHRLMYGLSLKKKIGYWAEGEYEEIVKQVPEEFRKELEEFKDKLDQIENKILNDVTKFFNDIPVEYIKNRKECAKYITNNGVKEYTSFYFNLLDNKRPKIKEYIFRNYKEMLEVD